MSSARDISTINLLIIISMIVLPMIVGAKMKLGINKKTAWAVFRMVVQLGFVGIYLQYIFALNNALINILYIVLMSVVASWSVVKSSRLKLKKFIIPIILSVVIPQGAMILIFNYLTAGIELMFSAMYIVPISGMLLGNTLAGNIVGLSSFYKGIRENRNRYNFYLSMGAKRLEATIPFIRDSVLLSINPTIASIATIGLVSLPGMMTGQILGGSDPSTAIEYQIAIMVAIFVAKFFSVILSIVLTLNTSFDAFGNLKEDIFV